MSETRVNLILGFALAAILGFLSFPQASTADNVETVSLKSKIFDNTRTIRILLPAGYHDLKNAKRHYPVFYLTDGIMAFRRLDIEQTVHQLTANGSIPPIILVGIDNGASTDKSKNPGTDRANEFLPYPDVGFPPNHLYESDPPNPKGQLYPRFLIDEVMPLVKRTYRIKSDRSNTGIGGFSYGGVIALYTAISNPGIFDKLLLESTPLWIGIDRQLLKDASQCNKWPRSVYIGVGTSESPDEAVNNEGKRDIELLESYIRTNAPTTRLKTVSKEGAKHEPSAWKERFPDAVTFLFNKNGIKTKFIAGPGW